MNPFVSFRACAGANAPSFLAGTTDRAVSIAVRLAVGQRSGGQWDPHLGAEGSSASLSHVVGRFGGCKRARLVVGLVLRPSLSAGEVSF